MPELKPLLEFLKTYEPQFSALAAIIAITGVVLVVWRWGGKTFNRVWRWLTRRRPIVPRETIRLVPERKGFWWHMGSEAGQPVMQVVGQWHATNITRGVAHILNAYIVRPRKARTNGMILTQHSESDMFGQYPILPEDTRSVHVSF